MLGRNTGETWYNSDGTTVNNRVTFTYDVENRRGRTSAHISGFQDVMPTLCEITGATTPKDIDGISMLPTFLDKGEQKKHEFLYWEFSGYGGQQAVRLGDWKAIRQNMHKGNTQLQLFNLAKDVSETADVAAANPSSASSVSCANSMRRRSCFRSRPLMGNEPAFV